MIPRGHLLGRPRQWRGLYVAGCACGLLLLGNTEVDVHIKHREHRDTVARAASQTNHPSRRNP